MKFQKGDKVKFLNEKGGGIVSKVTGNLIFVTIEDGFEIPVMANEILKTGVDSAAGRFFSEDFKVEEPAYKKDDLSTPETAINEDSEEEPSELRQSSLAFSNTGTKPGEGIYFSFTPQDQKWLIHGDIDVYLINYSSNVLLFSFFLKAEDGWKGMDYDALDPNSKILLASISREELNNWSEGCFQLMFYEEKSRELLLPVSASFSIKPAKLFKEANYQDSGFLKGRSFIHELQGMGELMKVSAADDRQKKGLQYLQKKSVQTKPAAFIDQYSFEKGVAEVDLHISALMDSYGHLKNHEIMKIQLGHFRKALDSAYFHQYKKLIVIHGIGNGSLKNAIIEELNTFDGDFERRDASFAKYGAGAIELVFFNNGK